ncbi:MAG: 50S ribosomal protein L32 [Angelakisella sp.]
MAAPKQKKPRKQERTTKDAAMCGSWKLPLLCRRTQCGSFKLPHRVCPACGYYKGVEVIKVEE